MPKVSILVPVYGVEKFIERCAISLFEQTFDDIEYIFVNDCTIDNSIVLLKSVLKRYPNRKENVKIINHSINKGLAGARNTGIENAKGEYILHIDSDDYLELNAIELLYNKAIENKADVVICDYILEWNKVGKYVKQGYNKDKVKFINLILSGQASPCVWNKLYKRSLYLDNGVLAIQGINLGEDFVVTPKLLYYANSTIKVDIPLNHYIQTNTSSYTKTYSRKNIEDIVSVMTELEYFFSTKEDSVLYTEALLQGKLRKKIEFILQSNKETLDFVLNLFPETKTLNNISFLNKQEKIIHHLLKLNSKVLLTRYIKVYNRGFGLIQKLKGRK